MVTTDLAEPGDCRRVLQPRIGSLLRFRLCTRYRCTRLGSRGRLAAHGTSPFGGGFSKGFATYSWDDPFIHIGTSPLCRFYIPPGSGDSHFLSAFATECEGVRSRFPTFVLETEAAFYAVLPDSETGECPRVTEQWGTVFQLVPVYRLWNGRADSNHRYTVDPAVRTAMVDMGYIPEGYGPKGAAFCVPAGSALLSDPNELRLS